MTFAALQDCLRPVGAPAPTDDIATWWPRWCAIAASTPDSATLALRGGFDADRVGWAFAAGYQAALRALDPTLPADAMAALCVTEEGGNRPRDVQTTFASLPDGRVRVDGIKRWSTFGPAASVFLVVGRQADSPAERPALQVATIPAGAPGLHLLPLPAMRVVPEVPHTMLQLESVLVDAAAVWPGDGYERVVKPFRTLEDAHVTLAVLAYLLRESRSRAWPAELSERLAAVIALLASLCTADAASPHTHVLLAGALQLARQLYAEAGTQWATTTAPDDPAAQRWTRDSALFNVAGSARTQRAARAWERLAADLGNPAVAKADLRPA